MLCRLIPITDMFEPRKIVSRADNLLAIQQQQTEQYQAFLTQFKNNLRALQNQPASTEPVKLLLQDVQLSLSMADYSDNLFQQPKILLHRSDGTVLFIYVFCGDYWWCEQQLVWDVVAEQLDLPKTFNKLPIQRYVDNINYLTAYITTQLTTYFKLPTVDIIPCKIAPIDFNNPLITASCS